VRDKIEALIENGRVSLEKSVEVIGAKVICRNSCGDGKSAGVGKEVDVLETGQAKKNFSDGAITVVPSRI
jgi:hypothetical protein